MLNLDICAFSHTSRGRILQLRVPEGNPGLHVEAHVPGTAPPLHGRVKSARIRQHFCPLLPLALEQVGRCSSSREGFQVVASSSPKKKKKQQLSLADQLLDYIEGGPKLRKWYGAGEFQPREGGQDDEGEQEESEEDMAGDLPRDAVLVTDADSYSGQLIVLALIVRKLRVRVLVEDPAKAVTAYGPYVEPVTGNNKDRTSVDKALRGVRAVICPSSPGLVARRAKAKRVEHIILLSQAGVSTTAGGASMWDDIFSGRRQLAKAEDEVAESGVPYTIVRAGKLQDKPGGQAGLQFGQGDTMKGTISREDAATVCVRALDAPPKTALIFEVVNGGVKIQDWQEAFKSLAEVATVAP